ncbi:MAG: hypothetical protein ACI3XI_02630 [Eubacteriales bacterium]
MILSQAKELLIANSILFQECEFANEADFLNHISQFPYTKKSKAHRFYALIIPSSNGKKHIELEFEEKNGEFVFCDLWFGAFSFEYFSGEAEEDCSYLIEEIQELMKGKRTIISVTNLKTRRWIADAQFDRDDTDDDMFGEIGFQKAMRRIRKKKTFFECLFRFGRKYEIYDWNTYECIIK